MIFEILTGVFVLTTIAGMYSSWNLMKKQEMTEDWLVALENRLSNVIKEVKEIDEKGMFEADDEVGTIFEQINSMITTLNDFLAK
jgi:hypothetical protein|tara:strand:- start:746 stop:1000 length:255 start_codon:yes stop_codon:yes gene_type:complete